MDNNLTSNDLKNIKIILPNGKVKKVELDTYLYNEQYDCEFVSYTTEFFGIVKRTVLELVFDSEGEVYFQEVNNAKKRRAYQHQLEVEDGNLDFDQIPSEVIMYDEEEMDYIDKPYKVTIYKGKDGKYYRDILGTLPISEKNIKEYREDQGLELIVKDVVTLSFLKKKKKKIIYEHENVFFYDKKCKKEITNEDLEDLRNDESIELDVQKVNEIVKTKSIMDIPSIIKNRLNNIKKAKKVEIKEEKQELIIYVDEEGKLYREGALDKPLSQVKLEELMNKYRVTKLPYPKSKTSAVIVYVDETGEYYNKKDKSSPKSKESINALREKSTVIEININTDEMIGYSKDGIHFFYDSDCIYQITPKMYKMLSQKYKIDIVNPKKYQNKTNSTILKVPKIIYYEQKLGIKKYYLDNDMKTPLTKEEVKELKENFAISEVPVLKVRTPEKEVTVFVDRFNNYYQDGGAITPISKEQIESLKKDKNIKLNINKMKEKIINVYHDEIKDKYYLDENCNKEIMKIVLDNLNNHPCVLIQMHTLTNEKKKITVYEDALGNLYSDIAGEKSIDRELSKKLKNNPNIELIIKKTEDINLTIYSDGKKYYYDQDCNIEIRKSKLTALKNRKNAHVTIKNVSKKIRLYVDSTGIYYWDRLATMKLTKEALGKIVEDYIIDAKPIINKQVKIYFDGENYYHDPDQEFIYSEEDFEKISKNQCYTVEVIKVSKKEKELKEIKSVENKKDVTLEKINELKRIREEMARILRKESFDGIEDSYEHSMSYRLDDYEIDKFQELRKEAEEIKKKA